MKIIHIFPSSIFLNSYLQNLDRIAENNQHIFYIYGQDPNAHLVLNGFKNLKIQKVESIKNLYKNGIIKKEINLADKIILHSFFERTRTIWFMPHKWWRKMCIVFWGGEIYSFRDRIWPNKILEKIKSKIVVAMRKYIISSVGMTATLVRGDYKELCKYVKCKAPNFVLCYGSPASELLANNFKKSHVLKTRHKDGEPWQLILGNSATRTNNHFEAIDLLERFKNENIKLLVPLSYGDMEYAKEVIEYGKKKLGNVFCPLTDFIETNKYFELIDKCAVGIFNVDRQQAMGNITHLIVNGTKIYLRPDTSLWEYLVSEIGCPLSNIYDLKNISFQEFIGFDQTLREAQVSKLSVHYAKDNFKKAWEAVFNYRF